MIMIIMTIAPEAALAQKYYRCLWKNTPPENITHYYISFQSTKSGLESSFCFRTAGHGLAEKECCFDRDQY